ncbi:MAG: wax ester/triacylglycerol synthase family O-acyltransferase [Moraxella sp.]|nr:wax ester/triacylglycerol synthase family O-acyltransferase [Moraxella sp.]
MRALSASDHLFLMLESKKQPMHVAGACVFELPDTADDKFIATLIEDMQIGKIPPSFPFNQILHKHLFWQTDENFRVQHHFRHIALPKPAGMAELFAYVSKEHSRIMDRQKPLWELHLIEGLAPESEGRPERFALYLKIHHAMADGVAGMRLFQSMLSTSPTERLSLPIWALATRQRNQIDSLLPKDKSPYAIAKAQLGSIVPVGKELVTRFYDRHNTNFTSSFDAPACLLNQRIQASRQVVGQAFDKSRFEKIASAFDVTTNDVILAVCAGALRTYLLSQDALPAKPLIAFVPVSLRKDDSKVGNQLSFLLANLATHKQDPIARLRTIANSVIDGKTRFGRMNQTQIINYSAAIYGLAGINLATGLYPTKQAFNLIISNVPGVKQSLYLNGARLSAIYPASVLFDGQALNITLANYQDKIDVGITACDIALPDIGTLLTHLEDELVLLEHSLN